MQNFPRFYGFFLIFYSYFIKITSFFVLITVIFREEKLPCSLKAFIAPQFTLDVTVTSKGDRGIFMSSLSILGVDIADSEWDGIGQGAESRANL